VPARTFDEPVGGESPPLSVIGRRDQPSLACGYNVSGTSTRPPRVRIVVSVFPQRRTGGFGGPVVALAGGGPTAGLWVLAAARWRWFVNPTNAGKIFGVASWRQERGTMCLSSRGGVVFGPKGRRGFLDRNSPRAGISPGAIGPFRVEAFHRGSASGTGTGHRWLPVSVGAPPTRSGGRRATSDGTGVRSGAPRAPAPPPRPGPAGDLDRRPSRPGPQGTAARGSHRTS
jgi:hypothetical protein